MTNTTILTSQIDGNDLVIRISLDSMVPAKTDDQFLCLDAHGARAVGVELRALKRLARDGVLRTRKLGRRRYFRASELANIDASASHTRDASKPLSAEDEAHAAYFAAANAPRRRTSKRPTT